MKDSSIHHVAIGRFEDVPHANGWEISRARLFSMLSSMLSSSAILWTWLHPIHKPLTVKQNRHSKERKTLTSLHHFLFFFLFLRELFFPILHLDAGNCENVYFGGERVWAPGVTESEYIGKEERFSFSWPSVFASDVVSALKLNLQQLQFETRITTVSVHLRSRGDPTAVMSAICRLHRTSSAGKSNVFYHYHPNNVQSKRPKKQNTGASLSPLPVSPSPTNKRQETKEGKERKNDTVLRQNEEQGWDGLRCKAEK